MSGNMDPHERLNQLQAEIDDAMARLEKRQHLEWADIGNVLTGLSNDIEEIREHHGDDHVKAHAKIDGVAEKLGEVKKDLPGGAPNAG